MPLDLGPGLQSAELQEAVAMLDCDPEVQSLILFGSRARGDAHADSDLDLLVSDAATAAQWAGSRWHVPGPIHREEVPLHAA
ncbi:MAG: nucleotidyltransferase domain-containing protein [Synechococcaceae cyanobacterium]|nr:nucleotidyltransferase domain-containing protein [Synechococcaceae cyanobacterium]